MKFLLTLSALITFTFSSTQLISSDLKPFEDKVVVITGASKGIGKGIAQVFAEEGAHVVLLARNQSLWRPV
ncbi:MAG: hypothetical protein S4CHLAM7_15530 [Chlamydiae bacterium]|nr:hypothetical protein [Chlamydiota bacterium]